MAIDQPNSYEYSENDRRSSAALQQEIREQTVALLAEIAPVAEAADWQLNEVAWWALSREDADMVHRCVELAESLPQDQRLRCAKVYIAGMRSGDEQAFTALQYYVEQEAAELREQLIEHPEDELQQSSYDYGFLHSIVKDYGEWGQSADQWINSFAVTHAQSFELKLMHARIQATNQDLPPTMQQIAENRFEELLQLTTQEFIDPEYFTRTLRYNWSAIDNPEFRETLLQHYVSQLDIIPIHDEDALRVHLSLAHAIITESEFEVDRYVDTLDRYLEQWATEIKATDRNDYELTRLQLPWRMKIQEFRSVSVTDFVECLDTHIGSLLNMTAADSNSVIRLRERTLKSFARQWAEAGDFDRVRILVAASIDQGNILRDCLKFAKTQAEIDTIRPDELTLLHDESLGMHLQIAEARCSGDDATFYEWADELLVQADSDGAEATAILRAMYDSLEGIQQQRFGQHVLYRLRETSQLPTTVANFSQQLIAAGNIEEAWQYFEYVTAHVADPIKRLEYLMRNIDYLRQAEL